MTGLPFTLNRVCSKCGGDAAVEYQAYIPGLAILRNRIKRTCERCGYFWWELPRDYDPEWEREVHREMAEVRERHP